MANENTLSNMLCYLYPGVDKVAAERGEEGVRDYIEYMQHAPDSHRNIDGCNNYNAIINKTRTKGLSAVLYNSYVTGVKRDYVYEEGPHRENLKVPVIVVETIYGNFAITNNNKVFKYWK